MLHVSLNGTSPKVFSKLFARLVILVEHDDMHNGVHRLNFVEDLVVGIKIFKTLTTLWLMFKVSFDTCIDLNVFCKNFPHT